MSVVVPFYNVRECVGYCMRSLLNQTFEGRYEVVCVDDGSTDGTGEMLDTYAGDSRVRVFHTANGGVAAARNFGVQQARAGLISFVDGDDLVSSRYLEILYGALMETGAEISLCTYDEVRQLVAEAGWEGPVNVPDAVIRDRSSTTISLMYGKPYQAPWGKLAPRSVYLEHPFPDGMYYEDIYAFTAQVLAFQRYAWIDAPLYGYVFRRGSTTKGGFAGCKQIADYWTAIVALESGVGEVVGLDSEPVRFRCAIEYARLYRLAARAEHTNAYFSQVRAECLAYIRDVFPALMKDKQVSRANKFRFAALRFIPWAYPPLMDCYERLVKGMS